MTKSPKKKLKALQRRLSALDELMKKYVYPPIYERQQYHESVPVCMYEARDRLLRKIRKAHKEIRLARLGFWTRLRARLFGEPHGAVAHFKCQICRQGFSTNLKTWWGPCDHVKGRVG